MKELVPRLIGPQGTTLTDIEETCGASLIVEDSGTINVYAPTQVGWLVLRLLSAEAVGAWPGACRCRARLCW